MGIILSLFNTETTPKDISAYLEPYKYVFNGRPYSLFLDGSPSPRLINRFKYIAGISGKDLQDRVMVLCQYSDLEAGVSNPSKIWEIALIKFIQEGNKYCTIYQNHGAHLQDPEETMPSDLQLPHGWERTLIAILKDWANSNGFKQLRMHRAEHLWDYYALIGLPEAEVKKIQERMRLRYNGTAKKMRFKFDPNLQLYVLDL